MEYKIYVNQYKGSAIPEADWPGLCAQAKAVLEAYKRRCRVEGSADEENMAVCAMAEVLRFYSLARTGQGGLRYVSVGSVSASGKGVYSQLDVSPGAEERELYRAAGRYLTFCRGVE